LNLSVIVRHNVVVVVSRQTTVTKNISIVFMFIPRNDDL